MKEIVFREIFKSEKVLKELEEIKEKEHIDTQKVFSNIFTQSAIRLFEKGMTIDEQRKYSKVLDKLDESLQAESVSLEDDQFNFLFRVFNEALVPPNPFSAPIADYLDLIKLSK